MKWFSGLEGHHTLCRGRKAPVLCVILGYLLRIAPKFSGCLAVLSRLPPLASGLLPIRPPQRGKRR
jgi:hypothetical protein